jgi:hypothetical protein
MFDLGHASPEQGLVVSTWLTGTREPKHTPRYSNIHVFMNGVTIIKAFKFIAVLGFGCSGHLVPIALRYIRSLATGPKYCDDFLLAQVTNRPALGDVSPFCRK